MKRQKKDNSHKKIDKSKKKVTPSTKKVKEKVFDLESHKFLNYNVLILLVLSFIIGFFAFGGYITGDLLFFFKDIGSDSLNQDLPVLMQRTRMLQDGVHPNWTFWQGMGETFYQAVPVEPYGAVRYFINYIGVNLFGENYFIVGRFLQLYIFTFLLSGVIFYYYLRTISISKINSLIGALLISFSGFMVVGSSWGFSGQIIKAVFLLFAFEQLFVKKRWYFFPFAVIFISSNPFLLYIYSLFLLIYFVFRFLSEENPKIINFVKLSGQMILLGIVGLLMNMANFTKVFIKLFQSPRVSGSASYSKLLSEGDNIAEQTNLGATTILRFFSNDILGTGSGFHGWQNYFEAPAFYIGLLTLIIFPQIFIHLNKRKKIIFGSFLGFWLLTLLIPYLRHTILAFTGDYFRYGFDFFIPFTLLLFAILALNEFSKNLKINLPLLGGTIFILAVALFYPYASIDIEFMNMGLKIIAFAFILAYGGTLFLMSKPKYKSLAQIVLILLIVSELSYFSYISYAERVPVTKTEYELNKGGYADGSIKAMNYIHSVDKTAFFRTEKDYQSGNAEHSSLNDALAQNYFGTTSYSSFNQLNYVRFLEEIELIQKGDEIATRWISGFRNTPILQAFVNVKYHLSKSKQPDFLRFGFSEIKQIGDVKILKNQNYLPFGYTYDKFISFKNFKSLIKYRITKFSINNLYTDLSRTVMKSKLQPIITNLQKIINKNYENKKDFLEAVKSLIGEKNAKKYLPTILKYSTNNFINQVALLNGFVYEDKGEFQNYNVSDFEEIQLNDTNILIGERYFRLNNLKKFTNNLKADTFQITSFSQDKITGKIELPKTKMLFFTIPFDEGWKIKVNGEYKKLSRVNLGFSGIVLSKGNHEIELSYSPAFYNVTFLISAISIALFWLFLVFTLFKKHKAKKKEQS